MTAIRAVFVSVLTRWHDSIKRARFVSVALSVSTKIWLVDQTAHLSRRHRLWYSHICAEKAR